MLLFYILVFIPYKFLNASLLNLNIFFKITVRPASLTVRGPTTPVVAGEMVSLTCTVEGARPAANITWYNRSEVIGPQPPPTTDLMSDGTYRTASSLVLVASRYDHKGEFFCKGINDVLRKRLEAPLLQATTLEVLCESSFLPISVVYFIRCSRSLI